MSCPNHLRKTTKIRKNQNFKEMLRKNVKREKRSVAKGIFFIIFSLK